MQLDQEFRAKFFAENARSLNIIAHRYRLIDDMEAKKTRYMQEIKQQTHALIMNCLKTGRLPITDVIGDELDACQNQQSK